MLISQRIQGQPVRNYPPARPAHKAVGTPYKRRSFVTTSARRNELTRYSSLFFSVAVDRAEWFLHKGPTCQSQSSPSKSSCQAHLSCLLSTSAEMSKSSRLVDKQNSQDLRMSRHRNSLDILKKAGWRRPSSWLGGLESKSSDICETCQPKCNVLYRS